MSTPFNIECRIQWNSVNNVNLEFRPLNQPLRDFWLLDRSGVGIDPLNPDVPNAIFANVQEAIDFYTIEDTNEEHVNLMIAQINGEFATDYVQGDVYFFTSHIKQKLDLKQDVITPGEVIPEAVTDAPTTLNVLTTLLGTLTGELNDANARYNDLAAKVNAIIAQLQAQGLQETDV